MRFVKHLVVIAAVAISGWMLSGVLLWVLQPFDEISPYGVTPAIAAKLVLFTVIPLALLFCSAYAATPVPAHSVNEGRGSRLLQGRLWRQFSLWLLVSVLIGSVLPFLELALMDAGII
jgi:hypothetical protein